MFDPSSFIRVHGADPVRWAQRYDLVAFESPCQECGVVVVPSLPFATSDGCRGLMTQCSCGHVGAPYCITSAPGCLDLLDPRRYPEPRRRCTRRRRRALRLVQPTP